MEFNYLVERTRMFNSLGRIDGMCSGVNCEDCPLNETEFPCEQLEADYPLEATEIVRKWAEEHPRKTRKDILLEAFPDTRLDVGDQHPLACAFNLGLCPDCEAFDDCEECWNTEVEE